LVNDLKQYRKCLNQNSQNFQDFQNFQNFVETQCILTNASRPYTITKKPLQVAWSKESEYVYNKTTQGPTAAITETGIDWRIANTFSGAGKYTAANNLAPYVVIISSNAGNYELLNNSADYEILPKPLRPYFKIDLPEFESRNDTLLVPSEVFSDSAALQQILD